MTRWDEGLQALLPETDRIAFVEKDDQGRISNASPMTMADGRRAREQLASLMQREEYYPPLHRVDKFTSSTQIDAVYGSGS
jgi:hypothetical protein